MVPKLHFCNIQFWGWRLLLTNKNKSWILQAGFKDAVCNVLLPQTFLKDVTMYGMVRDRPHQIKDPRFL
jgi:hypothetical protein